MNINKLLRIIVCLVLVFCLVVDVSPIKAEAFALEITGTVAAGLVIALLMAAVTGAVYVPSGQPAYSAMGSASIDYIYQWGSTAEQLEESEAFWSGLSLVGNSPDDDSDDDIDRAIRIPDGLKRGIAALTAAAILGECFFIQQKEIPVKSGWNNYGGHCYPTFPEIDGYPYMFLKKTSPYYDYYSLYYTDAPVSVRTSWGVLAADEDFNYIVLKDLHEYNYSNWTESSQYSTFSDPVFCDVSASVVDGTYISSSRIVWSNFDILTSGENPNYIYFEGSEPCASFVQEEEIKPNSFIGLTRDQLVEGIISANDLVVPDVTYANIIGSDGSVLTGVTELLRRLDEGIITHEEFMEIVTAPIPVPEPEPEPEPEPDTDPTTPTIVAPTTPTVPVSPDVDIDIDPDTLANTNADTFLESLASVITTPFKWIWGKIETTFTPLLKPEIWLDPLPDIALEPAKWIWEKAETFFEPLLSPDAQRAPFEWIWGKIEPIPGQIIDAVTDAAAEVKEAVSALVVPDKDYLTDKVNALCAEFAFADAIVRTGQELHLGLAGVTTEPPVIYIDLGATRGSYDIGGRVPFLDLRWYSEYKPTVDTVISAFLWICFVWRMLVKLPGIIGGLPGDFVAGAAHTLGVSDMLPTRSAALEIHRIETRQSLRKGKI